MGHRRTVALIALAVVAGLLPACASSRGGAPRHTATAPHVGKFDVKANPRLAEYRVVEVAVQRPTGEIRAAAGDGLREGLYATLLDKGYSPLAPEYVDAAGAAVARPGETYPVRSAITALRRTADGGVVVSGWAGLVALRADGTETTLFLAEITDLAVPPPAGTVWDGGALAGRRLGEALLQRLPPR